MKYLASYLLLVAGGKTAPTADDIKTLMASVGVEAEEERLTSLISALEGKNVDELIAEGKEKMSSVPTGGAVAAAGGAAAAATDAPAEEAKEEEKEESDEDMGFGLFD
ncbi:60s acidic ribosomal protein-domain-containing protein [Cokeromyces recurvatus]|uniref:60s acidic ribosomal protein-domain-containing protein n=1 Tax=Cokeromyces recurvatus TaxID=90255 RepID=UPI00221F6E2E|nr:60s acidic ribosomal protein-domain-containing protein [Cokeromyces recurvatus]KAI7899288.1 60s acidic ribosomal protein-domain-containing protein [Cokeromyces recurvatus]